ncbi:DNA-binding protein [Pseudoflavonifractor sp. 60]|uniref:helix-turn-helix domain-containing protein n=1 Tax=Pseudoflavonifractor sp. 60 TaxID=2304576 RepID=UPI00136C1D88|nr:helix-turn-helix domain-containing protein [Pseudoflavonifractor sp. 60]NBI68220.1 DNA-binding protein [Pseudoflavonifractor sp. 60]
MPAALMTVEEVGAFLGIDRSTVYRLCSKPNGLRSYKVGSRLRFKQEDVEAYLDRCLVQPPQPRNHPGIARFQYKPGMRVVNL